MGIYSLGSLWFTQMDNVYEVSIVEYDLTRDRPTCSVAVQTDGPLIDVEHLKTLDLSGWIYDALAGSAASQGCIDFLISIWNLVYAPDYFE